MICHDLDARYSFADVVLHEKRPPFHVYLTLPVHPEGHLDSGSIMNQVHWTMQSLVFGSHSLVNRVRRALYARQLSDAQNLSPAAALARADAASVEELDQEVGEESWKDYLTLLNLRNWAKLGDRYVIEQIYVHSKLMVVDDRYAVVGSANINDRSLLGERDSELAVLLADNAVEMHDIAGNGTPQPTRSVARKIRRDVWAKLFGFQAKNRGASDLEQALDQPANPASWQAIQRVAERNAGLYEAAFPFVPRNLAPIGQPGKDENPVYASIWPMWVADPTPENAQAGYLSGPMPYQTDFWKTASHTAAGAQLTEVKGFITALPVKWTKEENNNVGYPKQLIGVNEPPGKLQPAPGRAMAAAESAEETRS